MVSVSEQFGIGLDPGQLVEDIARGAGILGELLSPNWSFLPRTLEPMLETFKMAVVASVLGCSVAMPVAFPRLAPHGAEYANVHR